MQTYLAFLRGINIGGRNIIKMVDLAKKLEPLKFKNLSTYIQSGNLIFNYPKADNQILAYKIKTLIEKEFGYQVPVIVSKAEELHGIIRNNPYANNLKEESSLHVSYLSEMPTQAAIDSLTNYANLPNEFKIGDKAVYLYCPNGYSKTKLTNNFLEKQLDVTATTRNWRTSNKLVELATNLSPKE